MKYLLTVLCLLLAQPMASADDAPQVGLLELYNYYEYSPALLSAADLISAFASDFGSTLATGLASGFSAGLAGAAGASSLLIGLTDGTGAAAAFSALGCWVASFPVTRCVTPSSGLGMRT